MLAIPQGADQFLNAATIVEHGLGLRLLSDELSPATVRDAVREIIDVGRYRDAVRLDQASRDAMPPPEEVVPILGRFCDAVRSHQASRDPMPPPEEVVPILERFADTVSASRGPGATFEE